MRDITELGLNIGGNPVLRLPPSDAMIEAFEGQYELRLPKSYINFLKHTNGGCPELDSFRPANNSFDTKWTIDRFYFLSNEKTSFDCLWFKKEEWSSILGKHAIPIGRDGGGNQIYIDLKENGAIMLCIHDEGFRGIEISTDFGQFVDSLEADPEMI